MSEDVLKPRRVVQARRSLALTTLAVTVAGSSAVALATVPFDADAPARYLLASGEGEGEEATPEKAESGEGEGEEEGARASGEGEGEGEGEGASLDPTTALMRDLGFMEGHLRAGMALYEAGELAAAKTHMGHPIKEKYAAVAAPLEALGLDRLKNEIALLAEAAEAEAPIAELAPLHGRVAQTIAEARQGVPLEKRMAGLVALTRIAGDEYSVATEGGQISNLHEYQDSWGFLRIVEEQVAALAETGDAAEAAAAERMLSALEATDDAFGDLQGGGTFEKDASLIYGAAARMQLAAARLK
ncbi:MAG: hypothetical protein RIG84_08420 [Roseovarius sp.]